MPRLLPALLALAAVGLLTVPASAESAPAKSPKFAPVLVAESKSQALCESVPNRIFVKYQLGSECIAYYVTPGFADIPRAVVFFDGDAGTADYTDPAKEAPRQAGKRRLLDRWAKAFKLRYVYVSRVGLNGSSGNHADRAKPNETMVMEAALDILKRRLGFATLALAGQSRGSTIGAAMLTRGRSDIECAVLGSGAYELTTLEYDHIKAAGGKATREQLAKLLYDPSAHVDGVSRAPERRIFLLGDPDDQRAPIDQQIRFNDQLEAAGHHVRFAFINAKDELDHGAMGATIPAAGACLAGWSDDRIVAAVRPKNGVKVSSTR
jgi:pimeloyl-ACP methyl ester carboxylesterase